MLNYVSLFTRVTNEDLQVNSFKCQKIANFLMWDLYKLQSNKCIFLDSEVPDDF